MLPSKRDLSIAPRIKTPPEDSKEFRQIDHTRGDSVESYDTNEYFKWTYTKQLTKSLFVRRRVRGKTKITIHQRLWLFFDILDLNELILSYFNVTISFLFCISLYPHRFHQVNLVHLSVILDTQRDHIFE